MVHVLVFGVLYDDENFELLACKKLFNRIYVVHFVNMLRHNYNILRRSGICARIEYGKSFIEQLLVEANFLVKLMILC